jgi:hypothetical protein
LAAGRPSNEAIRHSSRLASVKPTTGGVVAAAARRRPRHPRPGPGRSGRRSRRFDALTKIALGTSSGDTCPRPARSMSLRAASSSARFCVRRVRRHGVASLHQAFVSDKSGPGRHFHSAAQVDAVTLVLRPAASMAITNGRFRWNGGLANSELLSNDVV